MLYAGLDLSRNRLDFCLLDDEGGRVEVGAAPPDGDALRGFARGVALRHGAVSVTAAIESMNGARFVHDANAAREARRASHGAQTPSHQFRPC